MTLGSVVFKFKRNGGRKVRGDGQKGYSNTHPVTSFQEHKNDFHKNNMTKIRNAMQSPQNVNYTL